MSLFHGACQILLPKALRHKLNSSEVNVRICLLILWALISEILTPSLARHEQHTPHVFYCSRAIPKAALNNVKAVDIFYVLSHGYSQGIRYFNLAEKAGEPLSWLR